MGLGSPDILIRLGFTHSPLQWLVTIARILALLSLIGLAIAAATFKATFIFPAVITGLGILVLLSREFENHLFVDRSSYEFYPSGLQARLKAPRKPPSSLDLEYTAIRHIELAKGGVILLHVEDPETGAHQWNLTVDPATSEDIFDTLVEYLEDKAPKTIFSIQDRQALRTNVEDPFAELPALLREPQTAVGLRGNKARIGDETLDVAWPFLFIPGPPNCLLQVERARIYDSSKRLLAVWEFKGKRALEVRTFDGEILTLCPGTGLLTSYDEEVGQADDLQNNTELQLRPGTRGFHGIVVMLAYLEVLGRESLTSAAFRQFSDKRTSTS